MRLDDALDAIATQAETILRDATQPSQPLAPIQAVVLGERARAQPDLPALYVFLDTASVAQGGPSLRETWNVPLVVVSLAHSDEPEDGYRASMRYAAAARSELLKDRRMGLAFVNDVTSLRFAPTYQVPSGNLMIYAANAVLNVRFMVNE